MTGGSVHGRGGPRAPGAQDRRLTGMRREVRGLPVWSLLLSQRNKKQDQGFLVPGNSLVVSQHPRRGPKPGQPRPARQGANGLSLSPGHHRRHLTPYCPRCQRKGLGAVT